MIPHALSGLTFIERFYTYPTLESTNETARKMLQRPHRGFFCIQADRQTAGKGRRGGPYFSDSSGGLWVSLVTKLSDPSKHFNYNRALSLAIATSLEQCGREYPIAVKWPNDIYWGDKKICGILLESHPRHSDLLILGFGVNVNIPAGEFPETLRTIATSVAIETGKQCSISALLRVVLKQFVLFLDTDQEKVHALYTSRLYRRGAYIGINGMTGIFSSVASDGQLELINNGIPVLVNSGSPVFLDSKDDSSWSR
ncbi:MAG: biotin--[acetyl-CoA-carboxylase] ligase [Chitinispirillaceae bacterium]|nr:biotin--[acetyl-CoA-carboxylase] ligase [Chitinispirillaceae bacterium]